MSILVENRSLSRWVEVKCNGEPVAARKCDRCNSYLSAHEVMFGCERCMMDITDAQAESADCDYDFEEEDE